MRWTDADLTQYGNDALDMICVVMEQLFYALAQITLIAGTVYQTFAVTDNLKFVEITGAVDSNGKTQAVQKTSIDLLNAFNPTWQNDVAALTTDWAQAEDDPNRFIVYPQAPVSQVLIGKYVKVPGEWLITDTHELPNLYTPAIAQYIVAMAMSRNLGDVVSGKSQQALDQFYQMLGVAKPNIIPQQ